MPTCPILGELSELSNVLLPTTGEILKFFVRQYECELKDNPRADWKETRNVTQQKLIDIWNSASIPTVSAQAIRKRLDSLIQKRKALLKAMHSDAKRKSKEPNEDTRSACQMLNEHLTSKLQSFKNNCHELFDIASCKCHYTNYSSCRCKIKIPQEERPFLKDQRGDRKMAIGSLDKTTNLRRRKIALRRSKMIPKASCQQASTSLTPIVPSVSTSDLQQSQVMCAYKVIYCNSLKFTKISV